jgi:hypothetical protein
MESYPSPMPGHIELETNSIWVIVELPPVEGGRGGGKDIGGLIRGTDSAASKTTRMSIPLETLKGEVELFLANTVDMLNSAEKKIDSQQSYMQLDEVQLSIEISAEGQVNLIGTGAKTGGKGAITFKFKRKQGA